MDMTLLIISMISTPGSSGRLSDEQEGRVAELLENSRSLIDQGKYEAAYAILAKIERMTQGYSENMDILLLMVHCSEMLGDHRTSLKHLDEVTKRYPKMRSKMLRKKTTVLERAGEMEECADLLAQIIEEDRKDMHARYELARVLVASDRSAEARSCVDGSRKVLGRWDSAGAIHVARAYRELLNDPAGAREVLDRMSRTIARKGADFHLERAKAHLDSGPSLSRDLATMVPRGDPNSVDAMTVLSLASSALGDEVKAREWSGRAKKAAGSE
jgi:tetratricopeptide (TPR) repeat protein